MTYTDEADAIAKANDHEYGLAAAVFTKIESEGFRIAEGIDAGMVRPSYAGFVRDVADGR